jgi:hypothetical protein
VTESQFSRLRKCTQWNLAVNRPINTCQNAHCQINLISVLKIDWN